MGEDTFGRTILEILQSNNVDSQHIIINDQIITPITYVIVSTTAKTRTCIHSPSSLEISRQHVTDYCQRNISSQSYMVHFDSRHTEAALELAHCVRNSNVVISIDVEKERSHLQSLLPFCDIVFTNKSYPSIAYPHMYVTFNIM